MLDEQIRLSSIVQVLFLALECLFMVVKDSMKHYNFIFVAVTSNSCVTAL